MNVWIQSDFPEKFIGEFNEKIKNQKRKILNEIKEYTGFGWETNKIFVYVFYGNYPSISYPILLNCHGGDVDFSLYSLIHELVHYNIRHLEKEDFMIKELEELEFELKDEPVVSLITQKVGEGIFEKAKLKDFKERSKYNGMYKYVVECSERLEQFWDPPQSDLKSLLKGRGAEIGN